MHLSVPNIHFTNQAVKNKCGNIFDSVLIPKVEYQPEYGFEKISDDQLVEYWLDTYFRNPSTRFNLGNELLIGICNN